MESVPIQCTHVLPTRFYFSCYASVLGKTTFWFDLEQDLRFVTAAGGSRRKDAKLKPKIFDRMVGRSGNILLFFAVGAAVAIGVQCLNNSNAYLKSGVKSGRDLAIINVSVIPMTAEVVLKNKTVVIRNGKIAAVDDVEKVKVSPDLLRIDGTGKYLMPGLADMHVHIRDESELLSYLAHGVTTVLNMRGTPAMLELRQRIRKDEILGPSLYTTGPLIDGSPPIWTGSGTIVLTDPKQADKAVSEQTTEGYDFLKVYNRLQPDAFNALMNSAKKHRVAAVGHIPRDVAAEAVLDRGQAMIAHSEEFFFTFFGAPRDLRLQNVNTYKPDYDRIPVLVNKVFRANAAVTPNLSFVAMTTAQLEDFDRVLADSETRFLSPEVLTMWKNSNPTRRNDLTQFKAREKVKFPLLKELTRQFANKNVLLLLGTDASAPGMFPGKSAHLELKELVDAGLTPFQALSTGTRNADRFIAAHVKGSPRFGTVEVGTSADLLLLNGNPLENVEASSNIAGVVLRGRWFALDDLNKLRAGRSTIDN